VGRQARRGHSQGGRVYKERQAGPPGVKRCARVAASYRSPSPPGPLPAAAAAAAAARTDGRGGAACLLPRPLLLANRKLPTAPGALLTVLRPMAPLPLTLLLHRVLARGPGRQLAWSQARRGSSPRQGAAPTGARGGAAALYERPDARLPTAGTAPHTAWQALPVPRPHAVAALLSSIQERVNGPGPTSGEEPIDL
jgi:hypothetical protein